jgi:hypothetical protein
LDCQQQAIRQGPQKQKICEYGIVEYVRLVLNWNSTKQGNDGGGGGSTMILNPNCSGYYWTIFAVSLTTLTLLSVFLYRLDVPSCTAPGALAVSLLMNALTHPAAAGVYLLILACACLYLLVAVRRSSVIWRYVSKSMLIWALYTVQIASSWGFWSPSFSDDNFYEAEVFFSFLPFPLLSFFVAAATNVLLNHTFFQILAVCFGSLSLFSFIFALMGLNFLMVPVMCVVLSIGCFRTGTLLQMYRVHLIVHARRLYQKLPTCPSAPVR